MRRKGRSPELPLTGPCSPGAPHEALLPPFRKQETEAQVTERAGKTAGDPTREWILGTMPLPNMGFGGDVKVGSSVRERILTATCY